MAIPRSTFFFLSACFIFFFCLHLCAGLEYQTLSVGSLPEPLQLSLENLPWSASELTAEAESQRLTGLSLRLHHIDSLPSDAAAASTAEDLFKLRLQRDAFRVKHLSAIAAAAAAASSDSLNSTLDELAYRRGRARGVGGGKGFSSSITSGLSQGSGEYFTRLGIGTPPRSNYLVLDTGSDINWVQCAPCKKCYGQTGRIFDPRRSLTFRRVPCRSRLCGLLDSPGCSPDRSTCLYEVSYGDGSFTAGELATETLTFRGAQVAAVPLGCGHDNEGLFVGAAGLLGLGRGKLSFPSLTASQYNSKFSYCLVDRTSAATTKPSSLLFGDMAVSRKAVFTNLIPNPKVDTFYYVGLTGFSVGGARVRRITAAHFRLDAVGNGGVIIDSGTSVTRLTRPAYEALSEAFRAGAARLGMRPTDGFSLFDTCYDLSGMEVAKVPTLVLHFGEVDLPLPAANYLIPVDTKGTFCFAFAPTESGLSIIGNIQQQKIRVVFDLAGSRLGFAPNSCG